MRGMATHAQVLRIETRDALDANLVRHCRGDSRPDHARANQPALVCEDNAEAAARRIAALAAAKRRGARPKQAIDMLFAGPPRYASDDAWSRRRIEAWATDTVRWVRRTFAGCPIAIAALHQDEASPHLHLLLVPEHDGRLAWKECLRKAAGRPTQTYRWLQDSYHAEVGRRHGLERGERGSARKRRPLTREAGERLARDELLAAKRRQAALDAREGRLSKRERRVASREVEAALVDMRLAGRQAALARREAAAGRIDARRRAESAELRDRRARAAAEEAAAKRAEERLGKLQAAFSAFLAQWRRRKGRLTASAARLSRLAETARLLPHDAPPALPAGWLRRALAPAEAVDAALAEAAGRKPPAPGTLAAALGRRLGGRGRMSAAENDSPLGAPQSRSEGLFPDPSRSDVAQTASKAAVAGHAAAAPEAGADRIRRPASASPRAAAAGERVRAARRQPDRAGIECGARNRKPGARKAKPGLAR